jgi:hypothetical protein
MVADPRACPCSLGTLSCKAVDTADGTSLSSNGTTTGDYTRIRTSGVQDRFRYELWPLLEPEELCTTRNRPVIQCPRGIRQIVDFVLPAGGLQLALREAMKA